MGLAHPYLLLALLLVPLYGVIRHRVVRGAATPWAPLQYDRPKNLRSVLLRLQVPFEMLLLAVLILALAGPHRRDEVELIGEEGLDVALALDISASMQAADFPPNRLEALKTLAVDFVRRSGSDRIAVYAFGKHVFSQTPLTTDHGALTSLIEGLAFETINHATSGGTALGDALIAATDGLLRQRIEDRDQVIVLITDGQSNAGADPILAARFAAESGMRLFVLGVGGDQPVEVYVGGEPFITVEDKILETYLDDTQLKEIAEAAGGSYQRALDVDVLSAIFEDLARLETSPLDVETVVVKRSYTPAIAAVLFPLFAAWLLTDGFVLRRPLR
ncbi:MAG: VWA domain-containing protein [bacterium]|nr:VWA domain-containing protein [bacterium]